MNLKVFKIIEPPSKEFIKIAAKRAGLDVKKFENYIHPQEDYLLNSKQYPIFAVADGVTLLIDEESRYPNPSGAGEVAKIFCRKAIETAEKKYPKFARKDILKVFNQANQSIRDYNIKNNRTIGTINFGTVDFYHITAAFSLIKEGKIFWGNICDAQVMLLNNKGEQKFLSPGNPFNQQKLPANWKRLSKIKKGIYAHKFARNKLNQKGQPIGYGVLTGEKEALKYVNYGVLDCLNGDILFIFTDGFADYLNLPEFINIFITWSVDIETRVKKCTQRKAGKNPDFFGRERSLIAVKLL
jgi:serine/threonine protein phosphatase PrpC